MSSAFVESIIDGSAGEKTPSGRNPTNFKLFCIKGKDRDEIEITGLINPTELKVTRKVGWTESKQKGAKRYAKYTSCGGSDEVDVTFSIDATETETDLHDDCLEKIYELGVPTKFKDTDNHDVFRPPLVEFSWGEKFDFLGVVDNVSITTKLFDPKGASKFAEITLKLKGVAYADGIKPEKLVE